MKKILIAVSIVFFLFPVKAQQGLHLGFKSGPQLTGMFNEQDFDNPDFRYKAVTLRSALGPTFNYHFSDAIGVGTELLFSFQGQKFENRDNFQFIRKVTYLKLPILVHFNSTGSVAMFYGYLGPQFGFMLRASDELDASGFGTVLEVRTDGFYKNVVIGFALGFGAAFNATDFLQFTVGIRFDGTFTDAIDQDRIFKEENPKFDPNDPDSHESKYKQYDASGIFSTNLDTGVRSSTYTVSVLFEIGVKYILDFK